MAEAKNEQVLYTLVMELPPLHQQLLSRISQSLDNSTLLDISRLQSGMQLLAKVEAITALDSSLRQHLLSFFKTQAKLTPDAKNFQTLEKLLTKPELFALQLSALGKKALVFSESQFPVKSNIAISIRPDGQLQILSQNKHPGAGQNTPLNPTRPGATPSATQTLYSSQPNTTDNTRVVSDTHVNRTAEQKNIATLTQGLREYLPQQKPVSQAIRLFSQLVALVEKSPLHLQNQSVVKSLALLKPLIEQSPKFEQLTTASALKKAIQNSGALLENKLRTSVIDSVRSNQATRESSETLRPRLSSALEQDQKNQILRIIEALVTRPQAHSNTFSPPPPDSALGKLLQSLFTLLNPSKQTKAASQTPSSQNIQQQIVQVLNAQLARISTLQIQQGLQDQQATGLQNGLQLELPLRLGETAYPLLLHLHERKIEDKYDEKDKKNKSIHKKSKQKAWHIYMELDLEELERFACELDVINTQVKTKIWVENAQLWRKSMEKIHGLKQELEKSGVVVDELQCFHASPPEKTMQIHHALVDIRT